MHTHPEWWRNFFSGLAVESLRRIPFPTEQEVEFLVRTLQPTPGATFLDVPCGTGRLTIPLAQRGYACTGVDWSAEVLADAQSKADSLGLSINFEQRDMRDLPWERRFDHAFSFGNSFAYLGEPGDADYLKAVQRALKPGGTFCLNTGVIAESVMVNRLQRAWFPMGDLYFLVDTEYDPEHGCLTSHYTMFHNGKMEKKDAVYRVYTYRELMAMFESAGFRELRTVGSMEGEPFRLGSPSLWVTGRKT